MSELLNASLGELLPPISVTTSSVQAIFTPIGNNMKDVIITNVGPDAVIITTNSTAVVPSSAPVQNSAFLGVGAFITIRKGLNKPLNFICPTGSAIVWASATNGT